MDPRKRISVYEEEFTANAFDIFTAASVGDVDALKNLLSTDSQQANARNQGGWTALMYASYIGYEKACKFLLECRANVNEQNCVGQTALMLSASCGNENVCNLLIQSGGDISIADNRGWNCLVYSASCNHIHLVKFLLKNNADPNLILDSKGNTPFLLACAEGNELIVQSFLENGADLNYANKNGDSPKKLAARHNHKQIYRLIENTKQINNAKKYHKPAEKTVSNPVTSNVYCNDFSSIPPKHIVKECDNAQLTPDQRNGLTNDSNIQRRMTSTPINNKFSCNQPPQADDNIKRSNNGTGDKNSDCKEGVIQTNGQQHQMKSKSSKRAENLTELFNQLQLAKYRPLFDQQEIDLTLFLQMTDSELKEIGVNLFGPRKKMTNAIARWHQQATDVGSSDESAYANYYRGLSEEYFRKNVELNNELTTTQELVEKYKQEVQKVENKLVNAYTSARLCNTYLKECKKQAQLIMADFRRNNFDVRVAEQSLSRICALCDQTLLKFAEGGLL